MWINVFALVVAWTFSWTQASGRLGHVVRLNQYTSSLLSIIGYNGSTPFDEIGFKEHDNTCILASYFVLVIYSKIKNAAT